MKTKYELVIECPSAVLDDVAKMVANHNGGIANLPISVFVGYLEAKKGTYPTVYGNLNIKTPEPGFASIYDGDKLLLMLIEHEVVETERDDKYINSENILL